MDTATEIEWSPFSRDLRSLADPMRGLARGFPDAQATLTNAADELDRLTYQVAADRLIIEHADRTIAKMGDPASFASQLQAARATIRELTALLAATQERSDRVETALRSMCEFYGYDEDTEALLSDA